MRTTTFAIATLLLLHPCVAGGADLHMVQKITMGGQSMDTETWMSGKRVKMAVGGPMGRMTTIIDVPAGKVLIVMDAQKSYSELSLDALKAAAASTSSAVLGEVQIRKTGKTEVINGWSCTEYRLTQAGVLDVSLWVTKDVKVDVKALMELNREFQQSDPLSRAMDPSKIDGFPVKTAGTISQGGQQIQISSLVTAVDMDAVPPDAFALPAGYKKMELGNPFGSAPPR